MRSEWVPKGEIEKVLAALEGENRLALEISLATGLRIGDVLALKTDKIKRRFSIKEEKTGKTRNVYLPKELLERCLRIAGRYYVFEGRFDPRKHRTRQAVFKDLQKAAAAFRVKKHISPHSMRKIFAVDYYTKCVDIKKVQHLLNHSYEGVTYLYAMADCLDKRKKCLTIEP